MKESGYIIDIHRNRIFPGEVEFHKGQIIQIHESETSADQYILPGFIDAHVHIESSMIVPSEFARMAVRHGTVATVSDPHEIGNVMGVEGVKYMIENGRQVPFKFFFGAPSCVPATPFETAGAAIEKDGIEELLKRDDVKYLAEMMNWPGVLNGQKDVMEKIAIAMKYRKVIDGHAPGLRGIRAKEYCAAGMSTDHECFTADEALDKLKYGMKILIREGSAAKNFDALIGLLPDHWTNLMFCSDDKHPDDLEEGHIDQLVKRALNRGYDLFHILHIACANPVTHYGLDVGLLRTGDPADFIIVDNLDDFNILKTYINGQCVSENGITMIQRVEPKIVNNFSLSLKTAMEFQCPAVSNRIRVIEALDGQLITSESIEDAKLEDGMCVADTSRDILKIAVVNRYRNALVAVSFIKNFGLKSGAIASSVAHDSHNVLVIGADDASMARAVNLIVDHKGGVSAVAGGEELVVPLPIGGLMSADDGFKVSGQYKAIDRMAKSMGSSLSSPFMTLSFMALLVIPSLKLSDKGLFNGETFEFVDVFVEEGEEE